MCLLYNKYCEKQKQQQQQQKTGSLSLEGPVYEENRFINFILK